MKAVLIRNQYLRNDKLGDMLGHLPDIEIVMQSDNVSDAPELCATYVPDMIIMDYFAKDDGIPGYVARIKQDFPGIKVFVLIGAQDDGLAYEAKEAGADVVARRNISPDEWRRLIRYAKKHYRVYLSTVLTHPRCKYSHYRTSCIIGEAWPFCAVFALLEQIS